MAESPDRRDDEEAAEADRQLSNTRKDTVVRRKLNLD